MLVVHCYLFAFEFNTLKIYSRLLTCLMFIIFCTGLDGLGLLWSGDVMGNIIPIEIPSAKIQENLGSGLISSNIFVDQDSNMLHIMSADKTIRFIYIFS